jgi:hypothetical protein
VPREGISRSYMKDEIRIVAATGHDKRHFRFTNS